MGQIKKLLGQRIKELRKLKGLTQEELASKIGIGTPNISYMETGKFAPSIENFEKLVEVLDVEPYEFYMFSPLKNKEEIKKEMYSSMDKDEKILRLMYKFFLTIRQ